MKKKKTQSAQREARSSPPHDSADRARRMHMMDAGPNPYVGPAHIAQYQCARCGTKTEWQTANTISEIRRDIPCPKCNPPNDQAQRPLTAMQIHLIESLNGKYASNGSMSTTELAWRNKTSRLAVWSAMRSLEAQGRAGYFRSGEDRWAASMWFLRGKLKRSNQGPVQ